MPPNPPRNSATDSPSLQPRRISMPCQHLGCTASFLGGGRYCAKHGVNQLGQSAKNPVQGPPLPANSRLGTEFTERSGKTARKGSTRHGPAHAPRPTMQRAGSLPQPVTHQRQDNQFLQSSRPPIFAPKPLEPPQYRHGSVPHTTGTSTGPSPRMSPLTRTTTSMPPPMNGVRRNGSSPLKVAHSPPSGSENPIKHFASDEMVEAETQRWYEEHGMAFGKGRRGAVSTPPEYDPRLFSPKPVGSDLLSRKQESVPRLLRPSPRGVPWLKPTLESNIKADSEYCTGPPSMPTPAGIFKGSLAGRQSRKRPLSPEPRAVNHQSTERQPTTPYVQNGHSSRRASGGPDLNLGIQSSQRLASYPGTNGHTENQPHGTTVRLTNGQLWLKLAREFNQEKFDREFYGQEGASAPPTGVIPSAPKPAPEPGNDSKLYLRLDPRIHWPRDWSDEWYEGKMKEIKARGNRKANWGKAAKRMREQRLKEEALAAEEQEALAASEPLRRRREPRPWAHRRHIDFSDVPEERLPGLVKADPAWLRACAWMRTNRTKELQRDQEARQIEGSGRSVQHLIGRTGW